MEKQRKKVQDGKVNIYDGVAIWLIAVMAYMLLCSDHHKRQESYLEDRCEELIKHNAHLMDFFKMLNEQVGS